MSPIMYLLLQAATPTMTYEDIAKPDPIAFGERVLAGRAHREIVEVRPEPPGGLMLGHIEYLWLFERPDVVAGGCVRRRWQADFRYRGPRRASVADLVSAYAQEQVALAEGGSCADVAFASAYRLDRARALALLSGWRTWLTAANHGRIACTTEIRGSPLCTSAARAIATLRASEVWQLPADLTFWVRGNGAAVIAVTFDALPPRVITVSEALPPPA